MNPIVGPLLQIGTLLIDRLFPDRVAQATERAQAEMALAQMYQDGRIKEMATSMSAIIAEAQSADPWTSRARPSFLYVVYVMILAAIPMGVLSAFHPEVAQRVAAGMQAWLSAIPGELYALFGAGYLGYAYTRTTEKKAGVAK